MIGLAPNLARAARLRFEPIITTVTGLRISAVDGTAFIDNLPSNILARCDGNHQITIRDAGNLELVGVLKAQGTGETVGSELVVNGDMEIDSDWYAVGSPTTNARSSDQSHGGTYSRHIVVSNQFQGAGQTQGGLHVVGRLYYSNAWVYGNSKNIILDIYDGVTYDNSKLTTGGNFGQNIPNEWNNVDVYYTARDTTFIFRMLSAQSVSDANFYADDVSLKQVTAPSATGATIVSTKAGTTYNFASRNASFVYNAASYSVTVQRI